MEHLMPKVDYEKILPVMEFEAEISKTIHHIFFGREIPRPFKDNIDRILLENPEYSHHMLRDDDAVKFINLHYNRQVRERFERLNDSYPAIRSDFLRYLVVYAIGGIYLDVKSSFTAPIRDAVNGNESFVLCQWCNCKGEEYENFGIRWVDNYIEGGDYQQWHIIAARGHPFLRAVIIEVMRRIDNYRLWREGTGRTAVFYLTGPHTYSDAIYPLRDQHPHKYYRRDVDAKLKYSCLPGMSHADADKRHYSVVHATLVHPKGINRIFYLIFRSFQFLHRKASRNK